LTDCSRTIILESVGRRRGFDEETVLVSAARVFRSRGYEGTSVDALVEATGVHRGSLYGVFGSKHGLFVATLRHVVAGPDPDAATDMLLVALLDLAPVDPAVSALVRTALADRALTPADLGTRLLARAGLDPTEGSR